MNLRYRRATYLLFFLIFFVIAPILVLYATGYRYNFKKNTLEKTGILFIESEPRGIAITVDGKVRGVTPLRIGRLLPNSYDVTVSQDGFYPWTSKLTVTSNRTTFAQDIQLFKKTLPILIVNGDVNVFTISPNREKLIYTTRDEATETVWLKNLRNNSDFTITDFNNRSYISLESIAWSTDNVKLLLRQTFDSFNTYLIINTETLEVENLFNISRLSFDRMIWDEENNNVLYGLRRTVLYKIDVTADSVQTILSANIQDYRVVGNTLYYIEQVANESFLNRSIVTGSGDISEPEKIKLPGSSLFQLAPSPSGIITLLDMKSTDLFMLNDDVFNNADVDSHVILQDKAKKMHWSDNEQSLLFYTDFELATFDRKTNQKNLITRYGEAITQAEWLNQPTYIMYVVGTVVNVTEAGAREPRNVVQLASFNKIKNVALTYNEKTLYIAGSIGSQRGIFSLELQ